MKYIFFTKAHCCLRIILILSLLSCANIQGQTEKSTLTKIKELKSRPDFNFDSTTYIDLLVDLAKKYNYFKPDSTAILLQEAHELSVKSDYKKGECKALYNYGHYFFEQGETEKAYKYNLDALEIANKFNLRKEKIRVLNYMGLDFWQQGDNENALKQYLEALPIAHEIEDAFMMATINDNIALLYSDNKDYETALTFHEKSRKISLKNKNEITLARTLLNMAVIHIEKQDFAIAEPLVSRSIRIFEEKNSMDWMSNCFVEKGHIALGRHNYKEALKWFMKAKKMCDEIDYVLGYAKIFIGIAESNFELKDFELAENYALKALRISKDLNVIEEIKDANLILSKIYNKKGQYQMAFEYQSVYMELYKQQSGEAYKKGLGILRSEMKFKNQKQILLEENNIAITKQKSYVYWSIAALFVVTLFLGLIYRNNKIQKKFTKDLQIKQEALIKREAELSDSNKTKDKLFSVIAHDLRGPINSVYSLMNLYFEESISKKDFDNILPKAKQEIHGVSELLKNLLLWGKLQMKEAVINPENINILKKVANNITLLSPLAEKKSITIKNAIVADIFSFSDRNYIDIVFRNLITNAIKFTNVNGEISIKAIDKGNEIQIEVEDNGIGMDVATQKKLFEKNNHNSTFGTNNEKGTGLGLSLCKEMVESNGGKIWASSTKNKGTTIFFTVPAKAINEELV